jgi:hypothetical protein
MKVPRAHEFIFFLCSYAQISLSGVMNFRKTVYADVGMLLQLHGAGTV